MRVFWNKSSPKAIRLKLVNDWWKLVSTMTGGKYLKKVVPERAKNSLSPVWCSKLRPTTGGHLEVPSVSGNFLSFPLGRTRQHKQNIILTIIMTDIYLTSEFFSSEASREADIEQKAVRHIARYEERRRGSLYDIFVQSGDGFSKFHLTCGFAAHVWKGWSAIVLPWKKERCLSHPMPPNTLRVQTEYVLIKSVSPKFLWAVAAETTGARDEEYFPPL
ncbi:hypothetical protein TNCV_796541 [Trichonephila clavipes]|uniref:Uncharacterized protein n=1 Tax=Trichonephila clavipes TaxID=2585209 RepID=A0A8X7BL91_TRICX|nr:hypothetical protein TNCV_796541 [Trichonephila clavipes]